VEAVVRLIMAQTPVLMAVQAVGVKEGMLLQTVLLELQILVVEVVEGRQHQTIPGVKLEVLVL
jgi:hypothetical protein